MTRLASKSAFPCVFALLLFSAAVYADLLPLPVAVFQPAPAPQVALEAVALLQDAPVPLATPAPQVPQPETDKTDSDAERPTRTAAQLTLNPADYQDWREAAVDGLGKRLRTHRIRLNANGEFTGRLATLNDETGKPIPLHDVEIMLVRKELVVQRLRPQTDGQFKARGLDVGVYDLIATGPEGFAAFSFQLLPAIIENMLPEEDGPLMQVPNVLAINTLVVPSHNSVALWEIINIYVPQTNPSLNPDEPPRDQLPQPALALENNADAEENEDAVAPATTLRWHRVQLHSGGLLIGRVRRLHRRSGRSLQVENTKVFLLHNNRVVAKTSATERGVFRFESVAPGRYSIAATGATGFAAFGFEAVGNEAASDEGQTPAEEPQGNTEGSPASPDSTEQQPSEPQDVEETENQTDVENPHTAETDAAVVLDALDFALVECNTLVRSVVLREKHTQVEPSGAAQAVSENPRRSNGSGGSAGGGNGLEALLTHPLWAAGGIGIGVMAAVDTTDPPPASPSGEDSGIPRRAFYFGEDQPWLRLERQ